MYSTVEIELTFLMCPIARKKLFYEEELTSDELNYYRHITELVSFWFNSLTNDEKKIIEYRCFRKKTYSQIASFLHYSDHSVVIRKYRSVLKKVQKIR